MVAMPMDLSAITTAAVAREVDAGHVHWNEIAQAPQLAIADAKKHPEFASNVKAVDSRDLWREADVSPKNQGYHYNRNAETYMEASLRLGWAMAELLGKTK